MCSNNSNSDDSNSYEIKNESDMSCSDGSNLDYVREPTKNI